MRPSLGQWNSRRLRLWLGAFFLSLAVPTGVLVYQAYSQLKWEAFHQQQVLAEELTARIDSGLKQLVEELESQSFSDYSFLVVAGDPSANFLKPSPLAEFPVTDSVPGLLGFFQIDADGQFTTPLVPATGADVTNYGITSDELIKREARASELLDILARNQLAEGEKPGREVGSTIIEQEEERQDSASDNRSKTAKEPAGGRAMESPQNAASDIASQAAFDRLSRSSATSSESKKQEAFYDSGRLAAKRSMSLNADFPSETVAAEPASPQSMPAPSVDQQKFGTQGGHRAA